MMAGISKTTSRQTVALSLVLFLTIPISIFGQGYNEGCYGRHEKCVPIQKCPSEMQAIRRGNRPQICRFYGVEPYVCCEDGKPFTSRPLMRNQNNDYQRSPHIFTSNSYGRNENNVPRWYTSEDSENSNYGQNGQSNDREANQWNSNSRPQHSSHSQRPHVQGPLSKRDRADGTFMRISERKCREYSSQVSEDYQAIPLLPDPDPLTFSAPKCQYDGVPLIVGGEVASVGEFPHMAAIGYKKRTTGYAFLCGGSLISENFVMTAAHCASSDLDNTLARPEPEIARLGEQNLVSDDDGADPIDVKIVQIIKHPDYKPPKKYHDIALLRLENDITFTLNIRPSVVYGQSRTIEHKRAVVTGWGQIDFAEDTSDDLLKVVVDLIDQPTCRRLYAKTLRRRLPQGITDDQLCAGSLEGGRDSCGGDSGGPIQVIDSDNRCLYRVIGLTSFGVGCGMENTAGVYLRVSSYVPWIENTIWSQHK